MPRLLLSQLLMFGVIVLAAAMQVNGQTKEGGNKGSDAALAAKDLAALQAFRVLVASRSYEIAGDQLTRLVEEHLRKGPTDAPKKSPTVADLQNSLEVDFHVWYNDLLAKATTGLDADGKLDLKKRLQAYLKKHPRLHSAAESRYQKYVENDLPQALSQVIAAMVAEQVAELEKALNEVLAEGTPTTEQIEEAFEHARESEIADTVNTSVLKRIDSELREFLLVDAYEAINTRVLQIVSDGVRQVKQQVDILQKSPQSHTIQGIEAELAARLERVADRQDKAQQSQALGRQYGVFPLAKAAIHGETEEHFDRRVESAADQLQEAVRRGLQSLAPEHTEDIAEHADAIKAAVVSELPQHHELKNSKNLLGPRVRTMVGNNRSWIADTLRGAAAKKPSQFDSDTSIGRLGQDIDFFLGKKGTKAHAAWVALEKLLRDEYMTTLVPKVRAAIAEEQSWEYSPLLAGRTWLPNEEQILRLPGKLQQKDLLALDAWRESPPAMTDVLAEVWQGWLSSARDAIEVGRSAMSGQKWIVNKNKPNMESRIRSDQGKSAEHWIGEYTAIVTREWQRKEDLEEESYPQLFSATKNEIAGIVARLLQQIAKEREDARRLAEKQRRREEAEAKRAPELVLERVEKPEFQMDDQDEGELPIPLIPSTANVPPVKEKQGKSPSSSNREDVALDQEAVILVAQNRIVDHLVPEIAADIRGVLGTGSRLDQDYWCDQYTERATTRWQENEMARQNPELLLPVRQRIEGLVAEFLIPIQISVEDVVRSYQEAMVREHWEGSNGKESILELIENDRYATQERYKKMLTERVSAQWQSDNSAEIEPWRKAYPGLLKRVEQLISGIVADAIPDRDSLATRQDSDSPSHDNAENVGDEEGGEYEDELDDLTWTGKDPNLPKGGDGFGEGDSPVGFYFKFYRFGFWSMVFLVLVMAGCWYWNVRYLRMYIAARRRANEEITEAHPGLLRSTR